MNIANDAAFEACEQKSYETLNAIKRVVNVNDLLKQHEKARMAQEAKRRALREEMNAAKEVFLRVESNQRNRLVERATKVEKVFWRAYMQLQRGINREAACKSSIVCIDLS
ncbi:hypothetical protein [Acinetobacter baumannii]|uniref:hypothetical protein n=1 Tax=Acinetobacter baumannii TaxID=470 RepID=UPI002949BCE8|nr:hypothetical protein [Acinetobacter baumannii]MDV5203789.1 hypothetical protein [Acinetobacter baumannii]